MAQYNNPLQALEMCELADFYSKILSARLNSYFRVIISVRDIHQYPPEYNLSFSAGDSGKKKNMKQELSKIFGGSNVKEEYSSFLVKEDVARAALNTHPFSDDRQVVETYKFIGKARIASGTEEGKDISAKPYFMSKLLLNDLTVQGPYFPVEVLKRLSIDYVARALRDPLPAVVFTLIGNKFSLLDSAARVLREEGYGRVAFSGCGTDCLALETVPNSSGIKQIIVLSPENVKRLDCPIILPEVFIKPVTDGDNVISLRQMPYVKSGEKHISISSRIFDRLGGIIDNLGLDGHDVKPDNVGLFEYEKNGKKHSVPFVLDWRAVFLEDYVTKEDLVRNIKRLSDLDESNPLSLRPWFDAISYIKGQYKAENVMTPERDLRVTLSRNGIFEDEPDKVGAIIDVANEYGLYAQEIGSLVRVAEQVRLVRGDKFEKCLNKAVKYFDLTMLLNEQDLPILVRPGNITSETGDYIDALKSNSPKVKNWHKFVALNNEPRVR